MLEVFEPQFVGCRCRQCRYSKTVTTTGGLGQWPDSWKNEMISKTTFPNDVKFPSVLFTLNMFPTVSIMFHPHFSGRNAPMFVSQLCPAWPISPYENEHKLPRSEDIQKFLAWNSDPSDSLAGMEVSIGGLFLWFLSSVLNSADSKFNTLPAENHPICNNYWVTTVGSTLDSLVNVQNWLAILIKWVGDDLYTILSKSV